MRITFLLALAAVALLFITLRRVELAAKKAAFAARRARRLAEAAS
jgi:hypothetical protein